MLRCPAHTLHAIHWAADMYVMLTVMETTSSQCQGHLRGLALDPQITVQAPFVLRLHNYDTGIVSV